MAEHTYTLIYFNKRCSAELSRWILAYAGIPYTDERVSMEDWPEKKKSPDVPGGRLPILLIDGNALPGALAIARYLAREGGLVPKDNRHAAHCDALIDVLVEVANGLHKIREEEKDPKIVEDRFFKEIYPSVFEPVFALVEERMKNREWYLNEITWADLAMGEFLGKDGLVEQIPTLLNAFPLVKKHVEKVENLPAIKEWIQKRPKTKH